MSHPASLAARFGTFALAVAALSACSSADSSGVDPVAEDGAGGGAVDGGSSSAAGRSSTGGSSGSGGARATGGSQGSGGAAPGTGGTPGTGGATGTGGAKGTGGTSGTGGAQGTGGGPIGACNALPSAGTWTDISPAHPAAGDTSGKNYAGALVVDPFDPATVWLGMGYSGFYKSVDCGATFTEVSTGRNRASVEAGSIVSMAVDPVDRGVIYFVPIYGPGGAWKTTNGGVDWDNMIPTSPVQGNAMNTIAMDPTDHLHLVVNMHANCNPPYDPTCEAVSTDGGASWTFVKSPSQGSWEEGSNVSILDANTWLYEGLHLWRTEDRGAHFTNLTPDPSAIWAFYGDHDHGLVRGADGTYFLGCSQGIVKSTDAKSWSLIPGIGRTVGLVRGGGHMYSCDQWGTTYRTATDANPSSWSNVAPPASLPSGQGCAFLDYDAAHHVLYSSNITAGVWRLVTP